MDRQNILDKEINRIMTPSTIEGMRQWYDYTLDSNYDYVVFVVRRSYLIALMMEEITGRKMESDHSIFLTDGSLFLQCETMAKHYKEKGEFPSILLCDDILIHGRNITYLIGCLEKRMCELLSDEEEKVIIDALINAIRIHEIVRSSDRLLIGGKYESRLTYSLIMDPSEWRELANQFSHLIFCSGMANAAYILSDKITSEKFEDVQKDELLETVYQDIKEYTKVEYAKEGKQVRALFTLRLIQNPKTEEYVAVPLTILPNLDDRETDILLSEIQNKMDSSYTDKDREWLERLEKIPGKRTFNELITLILSLPILQEFNKEYSIDSGDEELQKEITKIARNYYDEGNINASDFLNKLINNPILNLEEAKEIVLHSIINDRKVADFSGDNNENISESRKEKIKERIEDYFYERAYREEKKAYEMKQRPYSIFAKCSDRKVRGCGFTLQELFEDFTQEEISVGVSYFLFMMDLGILSVSSLASKGIEVVGYAEFAKTGEQALRILPSRFYEYIPMLARMEHSCRRWNLEIYKEIEAYWQSEFRDIKLDTFDVDDLKWFVSKIYEIGQTANQWNGGFLSKENQKKKEVIEKQLKHLENYIEYIEHTDH